MANILEQYRDRVVIAEIDTNRAVNDVVDIVLYDSFAQPESDHDEIKVLIENPARPPGRRLHLELRSDSLSTAPASSAFTATSPKRCPLETWWRPWRRCTPVKS